MSGWITRGTRVRVTDAKHFFYQRTGTIVAGSLMSGSCETRFLVELDGGAGLAWLKFVDLMPISTVQVGDES